MKELHKTLLTTGLTLVMIATVFMLSRHAEASEIEFTQQAMLENITLNIIVPCNEAFVEKATDLSNALLKFQAESNEATLSAAQTAWKDARAQWAACEMYDLADLELMVLHHQIDKLPDSSMLEEIFEMDVAFDSSFIDRLGSSSKGFRMIERLLFNAKDPQAPLAMTARQVEFLVALGTNLKDKSEDVNAYWQGDKNYAQTFMTNSDAVGAVQASVNKLYNEILYILELLEANRIGYPLGKIVGAKPRPEIAMAYHSQSTSTIIQGNLQSVQQVFTGNDGLGLADYLSYLSITDLPNDINEQLTGILGILEALGEPLEVAIETQPDKLEKLHAMIKDLRILMQVDTANQMGVTVTFKQFDGD